MATTLIASSISLQNVQIFFQNQLFPTEELIKMQTKLNEKQETHPVYAYLIRAVWCHSA